MHIKRFAIIGLLISLAWSSIATATTIAFVSDTDYPIYRDLREWVGGQADIHYVIQPRSLNDMANMLMKLGRNSPIKRLLFLGHAGSNGAYIRFINNPTNNLDDPIYPQRFEQLHRDFPDLPKAFDESAEVIFFNCSIGKNRHMLHAAGQAFLSFNGGEVIANPDVTPVQYHPRSGVWVRDLRIDPEVMYSGWWERREYRHWVRYHVAGTGLSKRSMGPKCDPTPPNDHDRRRWCLAGACIADYIHAGAAPQEDYFQARQQAENYYREADFDRGFRTGDCN